MSIRNSRIVEFLLKPSQVIRKVEFKSIATKDEKKSNSGRIEFKNRIKIRPTKKAKLYCFERENPDDSLQN